MRKRLKAISSCYSRISRITNPKDLEDLVVQMNRILSYQEKCRDEMVLLLEQLYACCVDGEKPRQDVPQQLEPPPFIIE